MRLYTNFISRRSNSLTPVFEGQLYNICQYLFTQHRNTLAFKKKNLNRPKERNMKQYNNSRRLYCATTAMDRSSKQSIRIHLKTGQLDQIDLSV